MKAGKYYVGDLCYVLNSKWDEFCKLTIEGHNVKDGIFTFKDGIKFATFSTLYGDGTYVDQFGKEYCVDAGLIGCILVVDVLTINNNNPECLETVKHLGNIVTFENEFSCESKNGLIRFGNLKIDTALVEEEDDDESFE